MESPEPQDHFAEDAFEDAALEGLHREAMSVIRDVAAAPPTSRLGRIRSRARADLGRSRLVKLSADEIGQLDQLAPMAASPAPPTMAFANPFGFSDPDDTHAPSYAKSD
jgi:hypothetical protein